MTELPRDPVIEEIREIRHRISARFDHDPEKLLAHYLQVQEQYKDRLVKPAEARREADQPAA